MRLRLLSTLAWAIIAAALMSCAGERDGMGPNGPEFKNGGLTNQQKALAKCSINTPGFASEAIGPEGGRMGVGRDTFIVPAGALSETVTITMRVTADSTRSVEFGPAGLTFAEAVPAALTLDYNHCEFEAPAGLVYVSEHGEILEILPSIDNRSGHKVTAPIEHFSRYAVAY